MHRSTEAAPYSKALKEKRCFKNRGICMNEVQLKRTWAEIDLSALEYNYQRIREHVGKGKKFLGVVKANAYGHGAIQIAMKLEKLGADYLAVATFDEAKELRCNGIQMPILILGYTPVELTEALIAHDITQTVSSFEKAKAYSAQAKRCGKVLRVHIKVDTGMSRLGFRVRGASFENALDEIQAACDLSHLYPEGIFTHFAVSDEPDSENTEYTFVQLDWFLRTIEALAQRGRIFEIRHCANSGAIANYPMAHLDMVRAGIILYGSGEGAEKLGLRSVMRLKSCIYNIAEFEAGAEIGYGRLFCTEHVSRIGVIPIGYADGLLRVLSNRLPVWTCQGSAMMRGRICMDMSMVDLTDLKDVREGDEVEIFGVHQKVDVLAKLAGTIPYELLCAVSKRVPRVYI